MSTAHFRDVSILLDENPLQVKMCMGLIRHPLLIRCNVANMKGNLMFGDLIDRAYGHDVM